MYIHVYWNCKLDVLYMHPCVYMYCFSLISTAQTEHMIAKLEEVPGIRRFVSALVDIA